MLWTHYIITLLLSSCTCPHSLWCPVFVAALFRRSSPVFMHADESEHFLFATPPLLIRMVYVVLCFLLESRQGLHEERLLHDIFEVRKYNALARPVKNESESLNVIFNLELQQIVDVVRETTDICGGGLISLCAFALTPLRSASREFLSLKDY